MNDALTLRLATEGDETFLLSVYAGTRAEELAQVPWTAEQKAAFCAMQYQAQTTEYRRNYPQATQQIIVSHDAPAGRLIVNRQADAIHILDIALLPSFRGQGTGTFLLQALQSEAAATQRGLTIYVEKFNPALRLYQRLGFQPEKDLGVYLLMHWNPDAAVAVV